MAQKKKNPSKGGSGVDLLDKDEVRQENQKPKKYKVVFHNDDYTPMELVASILVTVFHHSNTSAWEITMDIHEKDRGIAGGPYSKEVAETKTETTINIAKALGYPLLATFEEE